MSGRGVHNSLIGGKRPRSHDILYDGHGRILHIFCTKVLGILNTTWSLDDLEYVEDLCLKRFGNAAFTVMRDIVLNTWMVHHEYTSFGDFCNSSSGGRWTEFAPLIYAFFKHSVKVKFELSEEFLCEVVFLMLHVSDEPAMTHIRDTIVEI